MDKRIFLWRSDNVDNVGREPMVNPMTTFALVMAILTVLFIVEDIVSPPEPPPVHIEQQENRR